MGLLECASYKSIFRGFDYYKGKKVQDLVRITQDRYSAAVSGSAAAPYDVVIDLSHPRKSKCSCPHADGRRIVCKHMVAVYFTVLPNEAQRIFDTLIADEDEYECDEWAEYDEECDCEDDDYEEDEYGDSNRVIEYVCKMKRSELQRALLQTLFDGPEWQYDRFVQMHCTGDEC